MSSPPSAPSVVFTICIDALVLSSSVIVAVAEALALLTVPKLGDEIVAINVSSASISLSSLIVTKKLVSLTPFAKLKLVTST